MPGLVPLVVGITGHRDLVSEDIPALEGVVGGIFQELREKYRHTPLILLSPLAEGADRLAARVALRMGVRLLVPLPMSKALYVRDFETAASRTEFADLLSKADRWYEMPLPPGVTEEQIGEQGPQRDHQYEAAGLHIARGSQILIAMMEEMASSDVLVGGTGQTVSYRLGTLAVAHHASGEVACGPGHARTETTLAAFGRACAESPLDLPDTGPVYHVICRRQKSQGTPAAALPRYQKIYPTDLADPLGTDAESHFDRACAKIDQYNADVVTRSRQLGRQVAGSLRGLASDDQAARLSPELQELRASYAVADALAGVFQGMVTTTFKVLFFLAFAACACFTIFTYCICETPYLLLMYPVLLAIAYLGYPPDRMQGWLRVVYRRCEWLLAHGKYLDYRALAEGLRVQFYWRLAGLTDIAGCYYLRRQKGELDWITDALKNLGLLAQEPAAAESLMGRDERRALARLSWVHEQSQWFAAKVVSQGRRLASATRSAQSLIAVGVLTAAGIGVTLIVYPGFRETRVPGTEVRLIDTILCFVGLAGVAGVFWLHYLAKLFCSEQVKQYQKMADLFTRADRKLAGVAGPGHERATGDILRELGKEALLENADWLLLHRERPPAVETQ
jgi:hypothetical protein